MPKMGEVRLQMTEIPDVDIDVADHDTAAALFADRAVPASEYVKSEGVLVPHAAGVYLQKIPRHPVSRLAAFDYKLAESLGYYKFDLLTNSVYQRVESVDHLRRLLAEPIDWNWFMDQRFVSTLFHLQQMAETVSEYAPQSVLDLACMVAIKMPAKRYLIGEPWEVVREKIWLPEPEKGRMFKKSHAIAYGIVVGLDARLKAPEFFSQPAAALSEPEFQSAFCGPDEDSVRPD